jgi:hypothetical protein
LKLLLDAGVDRNGVTTYQESALRVLSRIGRFDAVRLLLDAGADPAQLGWTPLIEAVALGSLGDVEAGIRAGAPLEAIDWWERTAWLVALLVGDIDKAKVLLAAGANPDARGRCDKPALFYAIEGHHPDVVRWLLEMGQPVDGADKFGTTPLMTAVGHDDLACVDVVLAAGADITHDADGDNALRRAGTRPIAARLLDAGADPQELSDQGRRALLGLPAEQDAALMTATPEEFWRARTRRFGTTNPERIYEPFWESMIRCGISGYEAMQLFAPETRRKDRQPVWCAQRFGQSLTFLPDDRIVQVGGEHEDWSDPDFCIYNDVFVHGADGSVAIYGYPQEAFAPTDFHTATLVGDHIYIIGTVGYLGTRRFGETPLYRLDVNTFRIERLASTGELPGWISRHRAILISAREIEISGGKTARLVEGQEDYVDNKDRFVLDIERLEWRRERPLTTVPRSVDRA